MKAFLTAIGLAAALSSAPVLAGCFGSANLYTCTDDTGNTYQVNKFGNQTNVTGSNARNGTTWSQRSQTFGNTTIQQGYDGQGNSWNQTINSFGGTTTRSGTNSQGESFYQTCTQFGCY